MIFSHFLIMLKDANKNKLIFEATVSYIKNTESSLDPFLDKIYYIHRKQPNNQFIVVIFLLLDSVLTFTFPPTTQNIVVGALLHVLFVLFYFLFKCIIIEIFFLKIPHKLEHSLLPTSISKHNKNHWACNYKRYSHNFYEIQYDLHQDSSKMLRKGTIADKNT